MTRVDKLTAELRKREVDILIVENPTNVRYLTSFTGDNGVAFIAADETKNHQFFTDSRYTTQSARQVPEMFRRKIVVSNAFKAATATLASPKSAHGGRLGYDDE